MRRSKTAARGSGTFKARRVHKPSRRTACSKGTPGQPDERGAPAGNSCARPRRCSSRKGYANVTIDEIIKLIGGSKATLYARFGGKEGLFETVIKEPCVDVTRTIDIDPAGDVETQLTQIARNFLRSVLYPKILELHRLMVSIGKTFPGVGSFARRSGPNTAYAIVASWMANTAGRGPARLTAIRANSRCFFSTC